MARSEALIRAQKAYAEKNREKRNRMSKKSHALKFITDMATEEELKEILELCQQRLNNNQT